jgi:two-component system, NtrC family, sensor kinase
MSLERMTKLSWIYDLYSIGQNVQDKGGKLEIYQRVLLHIAGGFDAKSGSLSLLDRASGNLVIVAGIDLPQGVIGSRVVVGEGVLGWVMKEETALLMNGDVTSDPRFKARIRVGRPAANSAICWPLMIENRGIGVISVNRPEGMPPYTNTDLEQGTVLLKIVSLALGNIHLHIEQNKQLEALHQSNQLLQETQSLRAQAEADKTEQMNALAAANVRMMLFHSAMEDLRRMSIKIAEVSDGFYKTVLREAMSLTGAEYGALALFDHAGNLSKFLTEGLSEAERLKIAPLPSGNGLLHSLFKEKKSIRVNGIAEAPGSCGYPPGHPDMTSLLGIPLLISSIARGAIFVADKREQRPFSESDEMIVAMLVAELEHVMERCELMSSLNVSNKALLQEKSEQSKLITQLQEAQSHLLQSEKMASIGQLAAGVAHEINNPIGYVYSNLGTLEKYVQDLFKMLDSYEVAEGVISDLEVKANLQAARKKMDITFLKEDLGSLMNESRDGITRVKNIVQNLKDFSHVDASDEWQYADLHAGINSTLNIVNNEIKYKAEVVREYGTIPQVECLPSQLNQVFMNLLVNASHAIEVRGLITVRTGLAGEEVWVEVEDTGKGIAAENLKKIFDPFFTTKPIGKGTGLGLSLSYGIIQKHGGRIEVRSEVGKGTVFKVSLPIKKSLQENA